MADMIDISIWSMQIQYFKFMISFALVLGIRYLLTQRDNHASLEKSKAVSLLWWGGAALILSDLIVIYVWDQGSMMINIGYYGGNFLYAFFLYCLDQVIFEKRMKYIPAIVMGILGVVGLFHSPFKEPTPFQNIVSIISGFCLIILYVGLIIVGIVQYHRSRIKRHTAVNLGIFFGIMILSLFYVPLKSLLFGSSTSETHEILWYIQITVMAVFSVLRLLVFGLEVLAFQLDAPKEVGSLDASA